MKKNNLILGIIAFVVLIAVITNPNDDKHKSAVKSKILSFTLQNSVNDISNESDAFFAAGKGIGTMIGGALVEQLINNSVSTGNYLLFSTTKINLNDESKIIGFGAFGNVYLSDKIEDAIKNGFGGNTQKEKLTEEEKASMEAEAKAKMDSLFKAASESLELELDKNKK